MIIAFVSSLPTIVTEYFENELYLNEEIPRSLIFDSFEALEREDSSLDAHVFKSSSPLYHHIVTGIFIASMLLYLTMGFCLCYRYKKSRKTVPPLLGSNESPSHSRKNEVMKRKEPIPV